MTLFSECCCCTDVLKLECSFIVDDELDDVGSGWDLGNGGGGGGGGFSVEGEIDVLSLFSNICVIREPVSPVPATSCNVFERTYVYEITLKFSIN